MKHKNILYICLSEIIIFKRKNILLLDLFKSRFNFKFLENFLIPLQYIYMFNINFFSHIFFNEIKDYIFFILYNNKLYSLDFFRIFFLIKWSNINNINFDVLNKFRSFNFLSFIKLLLWLKRV